LREVFIYTLFDGFHLCSLFLFKTHRWSSRVGVFPARIETNKLRKYL